MEFIEPLKYKLHFTFDFAQDVEATHYYSCEETVEFKITQELNSIELNQIELPIKEVDILGNGTYEPILNDKDETIVINLNTPLKPGKHSMKMSFRRSIANSTCGLYLTKHKTKDQTLVGASTQCEPCDCRRIFACWDLCHMKAHFDVKVTCPQGMTALSNYPAMEEITFNGMTTFTFETSPLMSTYLFAMVIGYYDSVGRRSKRGVNIGCYTPPGMVAGVIHALDVAEHAVDYFADRFNCPYPWLGRKPKLDLICVPDFAFGAMENIGLITFRDRCLLIEDDTPLSVKQRVVMVICHEIAHMWFGNYVTCEKFDELWLNEAYAELFGFTCADAFKPEWKLNENFVCDVTLTGLSLDIMKSTHPIQMKLNNPREVNTIFDAITYDKGASIVRMLNLHIGDEKFNKSLSDYLNAHGYSTCVGPVLWSHFDKYFERTSELVDNWINKPGCPLIKVTVENGVLTFEQHRINEPDDDTLWMIPLKYKLGINGEIVVKQVMLTERSTSIELPNNVEWILANCEHQAFAVIKYSDEVFNKLLNNFNKVSRIDRLMVLSHILSLGKISEISPRQYFNVAKIAGECLSFEEPEAWSLALAIISRLTKIVPNEEIKNTARDLCKKLLNFVSFEPTIDEHETLRTSAISVLLTIRDESTIEKMVSLFNEGLSNVPQHLRVSCVCAKVLQDGLSSLIDTVVDNKDPLMEYSLIGGVARGVNEEEARILYKNAFKWFKPQNSVYIPGSCGVNPKTNNIQWEMFLDNVEEWEKHLDEHMIGGAYKGAFKSTENMEAFDKLIQHFNGNIPSHLERFVPQIKESIELNHLFNERTRQEFH
eukprot:TRINITY_DN3279_c7_g4_i1.p1 TRINITY_DN3279_c7_g4~~TRINITY_DN3279_c7_g4_i1.p1  ORF type:complete len:838 (+),score=230.33 TRINITY_DN3279_c7_g4_i1:40-2514(+)